MTDKPKMVPGFKVVKKFEGEVCVSMITFREDVYVATDKRVYKLKDGKLYPLEILYAEATSNTAGCED